MCPLLVATDRLLPMCIHGRGLTMCVYVCAQSGLTVWRQCQWLDVCACAGPVADWRACMACVLIKGLKDQQGKTNDVKMGSTVDSGLNQYTFYVYTVWRTVFWRGSVSRWNSKFLCLNLSFCGNVKFK